ncbi:MAG: hypothetical protein AAF282_01450 [Cyanobacteria bacterium P01_A01_bin.15]
MYKPPNKALLGCVTLLTSYASANLGHINAAEVTPDLDSSANSDTSDLAVTKKNDTTTAAVNVETHAQRITPDDSSQPGFVSLRTIPSEGVAETMPEPLDQDSRRTRLNHLIATAAPTPALPAADISTAVIEPPVEQELQLSQAPVQDSSGVVGDSFRPDDLTDEELRQGLSVENPTFPTSPPSPASSFGTPSAYGANAGDAFVGLAGITDGKRSDTDGSMSLGVGFGDAVDDVGVELNAGIISLDGFAEDGQIGIKVHKIFPEADNLAVAVGWTNPITWGAADSAEETFYGVVTKSFDLRPEESNTMPLTVSGGIGTGSFRSTGAIAAGTNAPNFFGSVGLRVIPELSLVSSWTGSALNMGISAAPFDVPLVLTAGVTDVTSNTNEGDRFSASIGYGFQF